jgi:Ca2+-binding RTX toxin-like protein
MFKPFTKSNVKRRSAARRARNFGQIEQLEQRQVMACDAFSDLLNELKDELDGVQGLINDAVDLGQGIPVIGDKIKEVGHILDSYAADLVTNLATLAEDAAADVVESLIANVLSSDPLNILGDKNGDSLINSDDVTVTFGSSGDLCSMTVATRLTREIAEFNLGDAAGFNIGLPSLPFRIAASGGITVGVDVDWPEFKFTLDPNDGVTIDLSPAMDVELNVHAGLMEGTQLSAEIGFLHATVTDGIELTDNNGTQYLNTELAASFQVDLGVDQNGIIEVDTSIVAEADVALHVKAMINQDFPSIETDFHMHWGGLEAGDAEPTVAFKNITVDLGSYVSEMLSPIVDVIQKATEPIKPIVDFVTDPIPVLSDLTNILGLGNVSLLSLAELGDDYLGSSGYKEIIEIIEIVVQIVDIANQFEDPSGPTLKINVGDVSLNGDNNNDGMSDNGDLRNKPAAKDVSDISEKELTDLVTSVTSLTNIKDAIENNPDIPDDRFSSGISYDFPFLNDPLGAIGKLLVGRDANLFTFTVNAQIQADAEISAPIGLGIDVVVQGNYDLDTTIELGYDTFGLRKFIAKGIDNNGGFDGDDLLDGLYIDADSHIHMDGGFAAGAAADYLVFHAQVTGGVWGGLHINMPDESELVDGGAYSDNDPGKIRPFSELGNCLFATDGSLNAGLKAKVRIGTDLIGIEEEWTIAETEIFSFDFPCVPNPFREPEPPNLATFDPLTGLLHLNIGPDGTDRNVFDTEESEQYKLTVGIPKPDDPVPPNGGDIIVVQAFGFSERFVGVKTITGNAGTLNDSVKIFKSENPVDFPLTAMIILEGGEGNDILQYQGTGIATIYGDDAANNVSGDDYLIGGDGVNKLFGGRGNDVLTGGASENLLNGGDDDDTLTGGSGPNQLGAVWNGGVLLTEDGDDDLLPGAGVNVMRGGAGDDHLQAGDMNDDLDGDEGNDHLSAGAGSAILVGNRGDDYITWRVGDGIPQLIEGSAGTNTLGLLGTAASELLGLSKDLNTTRLKITGLTATPYFASNTQNVAFEGFGEVDNILVAPLTNTTVKQVGLNLGDVLKSQNDMGDEAEDHIVVQGNQTADNVTVETELAIVGMKPAASRTEGRDEPIFGGIMKVSGIPTYTVRLANIEDDLLVDTRKENDIVNVKSITGPTRIHTAEGNDTVNVFAAKPGVPGSLTKLPDYTAELDVQAGPGVNELNVIQTASVIPLTVDVTSDLITSDLLPGVHYDAVSGNFGGGVHVSTGAFADSINVRNTLPSITTSIDSGNGGDIIRVGTNAPDANSNLSGILGPLSIEAGEGENSLLLLDRTDVNGNANVLVTANAIVGFAGPFDNSVVNYNATFGHLNLGLAGSDYANDKFRLISPDAATSILGNSGNDEVRIVSLTELAAVAGGDGDDTVEIGASVNTLDNVAAAVLVVGQGGNDTVNINDKQAAAGHTYNVAATSIKRQGGTNVIFDSSLETANLVTTNSDDHIVVDSIPAVPTTVNVSAGGQGPVKDTLAGPDAANFWDVKTNNGGVLNGRLNFSNVENLSGGGQADTFRLSQGKGTNGWIHGGAGSDTLDYTLYNSPVTVDLQAQNATNVAHIGQLEMMKGGQGDDTLVGPNLPNGWSFNNLNAGNIATMAFGNIGFDAIENMTGGTSVDVFSFSGAGSLAGKIKDLGGLHDKLDYSLLPGAVIANLNTGDASRVSGGVSGIEDVAGSSGDDILTGNAADNTLHGNGGNDIVVGLNGNDTLLGGDGRDLLIGGLGSDSLNGGLGEDLLIGNRTSYDTNASALKAIIDEWELLSVDHMVRMSHIRNGVGANGAYKLNTNTVSEDQAVDTMTGDDDRDWFWGTPNGVFKDTITDKALNEILN